MRLFTASIALLLLLAAGGAQAVRITPAHSGSWYDPAYDKQGFMFEVLGKAGEGPERIVAVAWYTYDDDGAPVWAIGSGVTDGDTVELMLQRAFGGARPPVQLVAEDLQDWAEVTFTFGNCNAAVADFTMVDSGETGSYALVRLTQIGATTCTGGMADEVEPGADPLTLVAHMSAVGSDADAQGMVKFQLRPAFSALDIDVRRVAVGDYDVHVGGELRGVLIVSAPGNGNGAPRGSLRFASPAAEGEPLLDFDPRGQTIEIFDAGGEVVLSATLDG